jgi:hypothetical protein
MEYQANKVAEASKKYGINSDHPSVLDRRGRVNDPTDLKYNIHSRLINVDSGTGFI